MSGDGFTTPPPLCAERLQKSYGRFKAVDDISFSVARESTVGLFGPNGAGKSTLLRMLAGIVEPTRGRVLLDGVERVPGAQRNVGVLTHDSMLYDALTARENLRFHARLHSIENVADRCEVVLDTVGLAHRASQRPDEFSHGLRKRLSLARALVHDPDVLLLDEPYSGLDRRSIDTLSKVLDGVSDRIVVLATHDLDRGLTRCSRALVIAGGRLEADLETESVSSAVFERRYEQAIGLAEADT